MGERGQGDLVEVIESTRRTMVVTGKQQRFHLKMARAPSR